MRETWVRSLGWEDPLEKGNATHSSILAWRIPWAVLSMGSQRVRHSWATFTHCGASQVVLVVKNLPANSGDTGWIPGLGISLGGGHGNPIQYSCLENPMDRGAWWATVHGVAKSGIQLKWFATCAPTLHVAASRINICRTFPNPRSLPEVPAS